MTFCTSWRSHHLGKLEAILGSLFDYGSRIYRLQRRGKGSSLAATVVYRHKTPELPSRRQISTITRRQPGLFNNSQGPGASRPNKGNRRSLPSRSGSHCQEHHHAQVRTYQANACRWTYQDATTSPTRETQTGVWIILSF